MENLFGPLSTGALTLLFLALAAALAFEFVNGFHDTANAVATVIYTNTLRPTVAVVWSGIWNLLGCLFSSGAVAFGVVALLPAELVLNVGSNAGFAMVFALLIAAIAWNLGTWYLGLPASSSHTLIGSVLGVGLANAWLAPNGVFGEGVNWSKAEEIGLSLLFSPLFGFTAAALLLLLCKALIKNPSLYRAPDKGEPPPLWVRSILILTCTGVSFAHGSNDGQKGMGLIMLILIGMVPGMYAVNLGASSDSIAHFHGHATSAATRIERYVSTPLLSHDEAETELSRFLKVKNKETAATYSALASANQEMLRLLNGRKSLTELTDKEKAILRSDMYLVSEAILKLNKAKALNKDAGDAAELMSYRAEMDTFTKFIPDWVKLAVALALGIGTMVGWKRIVITVGEKIGKEHLTYAQGASAELVAMGTIGAADLMGLPVSTTHVLSSGIAGTMAANRSGIQPRTIRSVALAWILTLPVSVCLGAICFAILKKVFGA